MKVRDIMTSDLVVLKEDLSIIQTSEIFLHNHIDGAPVVDENGKLSGLITKSHILRAVKNNMDLNTPIATLMTRHVGTIRPDDEVSPLQNIDLGRLPVIEDDKLIGIVTRSDLMRAFADSVKKMSFQLKTIINAMYNPVLVIDDQGLIALYNDSMKNVLGKTREIIGRPLKEVWSASTLPEVLETGKAEHMKRVVYHDKAYLSNRTPIYDGNKITGAVAVLQDVSEFEEVSKKLHYTRMVLDEINAIIESSFDGIFVTDANSRVLRINEAYERISGIKREDLIGKTMHQLVKEGYYDKSVTLEVIEHGKQVTIVQEVKGGKTILVTGNPVFNADGKLFRVVTNVRDITELDNLQRELKSVNRLKVRYEQELQELRQKVEKDSNFLVRSKKMKDIMNLVMRVAHVDSTVLIQGESGVGKELIAESIQKNSTRVKRPFIKINCAAIPENLLESELFGYEGGAFTGALKEGKQGLFEIASSGTLFLDEIGEIPYGLQVKLLRVLQERVITRVGGVKPITVNVRIIAATNRNLEEMVNSGTFRKDLFYRLNVVPIYVPPLRERSDDIPVLAYHFLQRYNEKYNLDRVFNPEVVELMTNYNWPGNVRELQNMIERLVVMSPHREIRCEDLKVCLDFHQATNAYGPVEIKPLKEAVEELEKQMLIEAFKKYGTTRKVGKMLGINQSTVVRKAAYYGLNSEKSQD